MGWTSAQFPNSNVEPQVDNGRNERTKHEFDVGGSRELLALPEFSGRQNILYHEMNDGPRHRGNLRYDTAKNSSARMQQLTYKKLECSIIDIQKNR
jgi:hypothetical protein